MNEAELQEWAIGAIAIVDSYDNQQESSPVGLMEIMKRFLIKFAELYNRG